MEQQQKFYDKISVEYEKLKNLKKIYQIEMDEEDMTNQNNSGSDTNEIREKRDKLDFLRECKEDEEEKKHLLQAVIMESAAAGFPMPPSMIKLMNSQNSKHL